MNTLSTDDDAATTYDRWCSERIATLTGTAGNLSLVGFVPVTEQPETLDPIPATVWRPDGADHLCVRADAGDDVTLDGILVDGETIWARLRPDGTPLLSWRGYRADAFSLDGSAMEVRIYDDEAPNRARFQGIETYPYDPALVVDAEFLPDLVHDVPWEFSRAADTGAVKKVPGRVAFELDGEQRELTGFLDGEQFVIVFADATTGRESYAPGRFLKVAVPSDGRLVLDLNRAFIPPCGFSDYYSCPLPPAYNRLDVAVRGGERRVLWRDDVS